MPTYVYEIIQADGSEGPTFEVMQGISEPPLTTHPETGEPVRRVIVAPNTVTKYAADKLSDKNLDRLGFTKYQKRGDGYYEKTAGAGPQSLVRE